MSQYTSLNETENESEVEIDAAMIHFEQKEIESTQIMEPEQKIETETNEQTQSDPLQNIEHLPLKQQQQDWKLQLTK
jgi:hypothetical protein